jgi:hypothetical protein
MWGFGNQNQTNKAILCLSHISPNILRTCLRNHHKNTMRTRKNSSLSIQRLKSKTVYHMQEPTRNRENWNLPTRLRWEPDRGIKTGDPEIKRSSRGTHELEWDRRQETGNTWSKKIGSRQGTVPRGTETAKNRGWQPAPVQTRILEQKNKILSGKSKPGRDPVHVLSALHGQT